MSSGAVPFIRVLFPHFLLSSPLYFLQTPGKRPGKPAAITEPLHLGYLCLRSSSSSWYACSWHRSATCWDASEGRQQKQTSGREAHHSAQPRPTPELGYGSEPNTPQQGAQTSSLGEDRPPPSTRDAASTRCRRTHHICHHFCFHQATKPRIGRIKNSPNNPCGLVPLTSKAGKTGTDAGSEPRSPRPLRAAAAPRHYPERGERPAPRLSGERSTDLWRGHGAAAAGPGHLGSPLSAVIHRRD